MSQKVSELDTSCRPRSGDAGDGRIGRCTKALAIRSARLGYAQVDFDNFNEDAQMFGANGSLAISDRLYLIASYADGSIDGTDRTSI